MDEQAVTRTEQHSPALTVNAKQAAAMLNGWPAKDIEKLLWQAAKCNSSYEVYSMNGRIRKNDLTQPQQQLLELIQSINFGRIEQLIIRNGQPVMEQPPRVIREIKLGGENSHRIERGLEDYVLKKQHCDLFDHFYILHDAMVCQLVIQNGLPIRMSVEDIAA